MGEDSPIPNKEGYRLDTLEALQRLGPTVIRFPGGTVADEYRWEDGIGPRDQRPVTWNIFFWGRKIISSARTSFYGSASW